MARRYALFGVVCILLFFFASLVYGEDGANVCPPDQLVFPAKPGNVTFKHKLHADRTQSCTVCHDGIFPKDAKVPLNYKPHPKAEASKTSCAACHVVGGTSFPSKGSCMKCHVK